LHLIDTDAAEMIREGYTPRKVITPSLVQLPGYMTSSLVQ